MAKPTKQSGPGQYVQGYVLAFIAAQATDADKPRMEALVSQARALLP
jgi:hypothetical protein